MKEDIKVVPYFRKNKVEAVIYVRGNKKEMQEMLCRLCAINKGYNVIFVTDDINEVKDCDVLLATNPSRINRDQFKYYETLNKLKKKNIKVEFVVEYNGLIDDLELVYFLNK